MTKKLKIKAYHIVTLILSVIQIVPLILIFALSFISGGYESVFQNIYRNMGVEEYEMLASYTVNEILAISRIVFALAVLAVIIYGIVDSVFGICGKISITEHYKTFRKSHITAVIDFGIIALFFGIITNVIREEAGFESCFNSFILMIVFMVFTLIHGFMAMLPYELSKLSDSDPVKKSNFNWKMALIGGGGSVVLCAVICAVAFFLSNGIGLSGKFGKYMESENRYGYIIEFNSDGSCLLEQVYSSEIISGTFKKEGENYVINWDSYYSSWIVKKQGDTLYINGMGMGADGSEFKKIG